jgi:hypothetical protein
MAQTSRSVLWLSLAFSLACGGGSDGTHGGSRGALEAEGDEDASEESEASEESAQDEGEGEEAADDFDRDDCKIEDEAIGQEGALLTLGEKTVTVHDWVGKDGEPGEFVGFSLTVEGGDTISYVVKAGGETHPSNELTWSHPNGTGGSEVPGISHIDFCPECEDGDCGGDGDGDGEDAGDGDGDVGDGDGDAGDGDGDGVIPEPL